MIKSKSQGAKNKGCKSHGATKYLTLIIILFMTSLLYSFGLEDIDREELMELK
jgi:hypothetical protein